MRFKRMERYERVEWTPRKLAAFLGRETRQRRKVDEAFALLGAALLEPPAPVADPDAELAARRALSADSERRMRDLTARQWRHGRAQYQACDPVTHEAIRKAWAAWTGPATPVMFIYVVEQHTGEAKRRRQGYRRADAELRERIRAKTPAQGEMAL